MTTVSIDIEQCPPGLLPLHAHSQSHTCLILSGELSDREWRNNSPPACSGEVLLYPAGTTHLIEAGTEGMQCAVIEWAQHICIHAAYRFSAERLREKTSRLTDALGSSNPARRKIAQHEAASGLRFAIRESDYEAPADWLQETHSTIRRHNKTITIGKLAAWAGVHRASLSKRFKQAYGLSPEQYKMIVKLEHAADLIMAGETLAMAAMTAGFADQPHFNRVWRHYLGSTPRYWQKLMATIVQDSASEILSN